MQSFRLTLGAESPRNHRQYKTAGMEGPPNFHKSMSMSSLDSIAL